MHQQDQLSTAAEVLGQGFVDVCSQRAVCTEMSSYSKGRRRRLIPAKCSVYGPHQNEHPPTLQGGAIHIHFKIVAYSSVNFPFSLTALSLFLSFSFVAVLRACFLLPFHR